MPVLAKFSKAVYDKLGDEAVTELVDYLNQVYDRRAEMEGLRGDLRALTNDVHALTLRVIERLPMPPQQVP
jgi:hypothetical protein